MLPSTISYDDVLKFETFLFDADGVLWMGNIPIPGASDFVASLADANKRIFIISNNPRRTLDEYMSKIKRLGFRGFKKKNVINSGLVMAAYFRDRPDYAGQPVYLLGTESLKMTLESIGKVRCFGVGPDDSEDDSAENYMSNSLNPKAVICSHDDYLSYSKVMKAAYFLKRSEVEYLVTDEDYALPPVKQCEEFPQSGCASIIVRDISGRIPKVFGKPHKPMADFLKKKEHIDPTKTIMFGDRLETDIQFANENGFTSCLMLTGVHSLEDVKKAQRCGNTHLIPDYVFSFSSR